jgi:glycerol-3-phosphate dehydrogenase
VNGAGIARDACGRGLSVLLAERADLASGTSSWSSKLIHGGLRYLEHYEFRLVAESLAEREVLLRIAGHLVHPLRFVMPHVPELRPRWMIRVGLFLYDHLGRRTTLPGSRAERLDRSPFGHGLKPELRHGFSYSDCRVDDARLVVANALDARARGAQVLTRTACLSARREQGLWRVRLAGEREVRARAVVNAAGPWVKGVLNERLAQPSAENVQLIKGSHIVLPRLYEGEHAFILQNDDRRVVFMIPFEERFTLVGTTDVPERGDPEAAAASDEEVEYLCRAVNRYLARPAVPADAVWRFAGVRPLYDDGTSDPSAITRDYTLRIDDEDGAAPVISVFGGKITTYRRLAEEVLSRLARYFPDLRRPWTDRAALPGSDFGGATPAEAWRALSARYARLPEAAVRGIFRRHGALAGEVLGEGDLGEHYGADLYEREVSYLRASEWAVGADDILWRRTKAGLHMTREQRERFAARFGA